MHFKRSPGALRGLITTFLLAASILAAPEVASAEVRIKDIASFEGIRENQLVGYGIIVGLNGSGDSAGNSPFTSQAVKGMLQKLGAGNVPQEDIGTDNVAAVMVTASLAPFARQGSTIDVVVSSLGDASSLRGGTLVVTPLSGADGSVYAVAQGPVSVAGYAAQGNGASVVQGVPTVARIENGATVEREIHFDLNSLENIRIALQEPDFTTAKRVADAINTHLGSKAARMLDPTTIRVSRAPGDDVPMMIAELENLTLTPDTKAKVVIDAKSGTIVIGSNVRIDRVAVSQGGLTVKIEETPEVVQPEPITIGGTTVVVPETNIEVQTKDADFVVLEGGDVSLQDLVDGLNAIGVGAEETISILQAIKAAGALHADLEII
ncbi:flagellar basal body P-ring protein FlgI [Salipiger sp. PrR003]|uniref:flagellar basal body P-ring protein FlgI n=1 Tax=Salipiger sp. PrR003 TaxID=2706776 RepID=UPI0013D99C99|nr:flagellar basal body P-ring protein FlgI [Salipiger sp. PrR003]NDV50782.1 flagellar basal body P-ring protein FlgI [Salipiger sp. PrR003]